MNTEYLQIFKKRQKYKNLLNAALIRLHKTNISNAAINKNFNTIIDLYNDLRNSFHNAEFKLNPKQKLETSNFLANIKLKLISISEKHQIRLCCVDNNIVRLPNEDSSESDSVDLDTTTYEEAEDKMPITITEFLSLASKLLPEFDGTKENLQRFIDALQIINSIKESHESTAVELIKTKLKGSSRNIITDESTINQIINKLKSKIKGETVDTITAKIMNIKQQNKSANIYVKEIEELTKALEGAYISDGLNTEVAEKYTTRAAVKAITTNTNNEKVKLIIESGNFGNVNEVMSKFINATNDASTSQNTVFYYNRNNYQRNNQYRGRGRGRFNYNTSRYNNNNYNNNNKYNNNNRGRNGYHGNNRGGSYNRPYNNYGNNNGNYQNNNNRNIRFTNNNESENVDGPVVHQLQQGGTY